MSIEERVSAVEGTITSQDRIFDMLHGGQQNLRDDIAGLRDETRASFRELRCDMDKRFREVDARIIETNERIVAMEVRLDAKTDSNFKWIVGVQIVMWVTIVVVVLRVSGWL